MHSPPSATSRRRERCFRRAWLLDSAPVKSRRRRNAQDRIQYTPGHDSRQATGQLHHFGRWRFGVKFWVATSDHIHSRRCWRAPGSDPRPPPRAQLPSAYSPRHTGLCDCPLRNSLACNVVVVVVVVTVTHGSLIARPLHTARVPVRLTQRDSLSTGPRQK